MASNGITSWTEEDVRAKVISQWLVGHGFSCNDLFLEFSFTIQLGRSHFEVSDGQIKRVRSQELATQHRTSSCHPRADILVRDGEGRNLLIIEVKAPDEPLDDKGRDQGISYARLLISGNIAPFVVLTNGHETKIFDSLTKERLDGMAIPTDHLYVRAGYRISGDDIALRAEALSALISLSPSNLNSFCSAQVERRMALLRSTDLQSGKKYIPSLYIEREHAKHKLEELLDAQYRPVVLLIGPPQVGKTNFLCHVAEERLARGEACLFYPAVGMRQGLLAEIVSDFEWVLGESQLSQRQVIAKLHNILRRINRKLVIFIDGWNEASVSMAEAIDQESELICHNGIQIVISVTSTSLKRLLIGEAGNPSFIAQAAALDPGAVQLLGISPDAEQLNYKYSSIQLKDGYSDVDHQNQKWSVISLPRYSEGEMHAAYDVYAGAFNVIIPQSHKLESEPYTLSIAMRYFQNGTLPNQFDEPELMEKHITNKINRAVGLRQHDGRAFLRELASAMFDNGAPLSTKNALKLWGLPTVAVVPPGLFEAALLAEITARHGESTIDFYYGRERDFIIACWVRDWQTKLQCGNDMSAEFELAALSNAGLDALRWFLRKPAHIGLIESNHGALPVFSGPQVRAVLLSALCDISRRGFGNNEAWLRHALRRAQLDPNILVRIEAVKLVSLLTDESNDICDALLGAGTSLYDFIVELLALAENVSIELGDVEKVILDAFRAMHNNDSENDDFLSESGVSSILEMLVDNESPILRRKAAEFLGHIAPAILLKLITKKLKAGILSPGSPEAKELENGVINASSSLGAYFYGDMCPGAMNYLREAPEERREIYLTLFPIAGAAIYLYNGSSEAERISDLLEDLEVDDSEIDEDEAEEMWSRPSLDLLTLPLPFDSSDKDE
jgi:type I restriction and modification enzyme subunit R-like protein